MVAAKGRAAARAAAVAALRRALAREGHAPAGARATALHAAAVAWLAASPAGHVQVALADLAGARRPHNIPGNVAEDSSWRGRHRAPVAALLGRRAVRAALRRLAAGRQAAGLSP